MLRARPLRELSGDVTRAGTGGARDGLGSERERLRAGRGWTRDGRVKGLAVPACGCGPRHASPPLASSHGPTAAVRLRGSLGIGLDATWRDGSRIASVASVLDRHLTLTPLCSAPMHRRTRDRAQQLRRVTRHPTVTAAAPPLIPRPPSPQPAPDAAAAATTAHPPPSHHTSPPETASHRSHHPPSSHFPLHAPRPAGQRTQPRCPPTARPVPLTPHLSSPPPLLYPPWPSWRDTSLTLHLPPHLPPRWRLPPSPTALSTATTPPPTQPPPPTPPPPPPPPPLRSRPPLPSPSPPRTPPPSPPPPASRTSSPPSSPLPCPLTPTPPPTRPPASPSPTTFAPRVVATPSPASSSPTTASPPSRPSAPYASGPTRRSATTTPSSSWPWPPPRI